MPAVDFAALPETVADRHGAVPIELDRPLTTWPELGRSLDYERFAELVAEASGWLAAAGVRSGDRVAVVKRNDPDIQVLLYACLRLGAIPGLISARLGPRDTGPMLDRLDPKAIVSDLATLTGSGMGGHRSTTTICLDGELPGCLGRADLSGGRTPDPAPRRGREPALVLHTSGTTGVPKLVQHTARSMHRGAFVGLHHRSPRFAPLSNSDTVAACLAWGHVRAVFGLALAMFKGARLVAISDPAPAGVGAVLASARPSVLKTHPNIFLRWRHLADEGAQPLRSVRIFLSTADAIHPPTIRALLEASGRPRPVFIQVYGITELGPVSVRLFTRRGARALQDARGAGRTIPLHSRARVVDPRSGRRVRPGVPGVIQARTASRFHTYVGEEGPAGDAWFTTADRGMRSWTGGLRLLDREVDHIPGLASTLAIEELLL